ncbi:hypothetical protein GCM10027199_39180 [Amycolatopsis magusensis]
MWGSGAGEFYVQEAELHTGEAEFYVGEVECDVGVVEFCIRAVRGFVVRGNADGDSDKLS